MSRALRSAAVRRGGLARLECFRERAISTPISLCCRLGKLATLRVLKTQKLEMLPTGSDALYQAQADIRHLKNTIAVLRGELEVMRLRKDEAVQAAVAAGRDEAHQLQTTIAALRDELEQKGFQRADELEHGKQALNDEVRQLREMVAVMRRELEGKWSNGVTASSARTTAPVVREKGRQVKGME